jgi:hypothetical protein
VKNGRLVDLLGFAGAGEVIVLQERFVARAIFLRFGIPLSGGF